MPDLPESIKNSVRVQSGKSGKTGESGNLAKLADTCNL